LTRNPIDPMMSAEMIPRRGSVRDEREVRRLLSGAIATRAMSGSRSRKVDRATSPSLGRKIEGVRRGRPRKPGDFPRHVRRPDVKRHTPVHVTLRMKKHVWKLRATRCFRIIRRAFVNGGSRFGFRLVHFSVQGNHIHLIGEAESTLAVSRALKGLGVRIARGLNGVMRRSGPVIAERYHLRLIETAAQARRTLLYVLNNYRRHAAQWGETLSDEFVDPCSSATSFDGWSRRPWRRAGPHAQRDPCPELPLGTQAPRSRLLTSAWRSSGRLDPATVPGPFREQSAP
jgi:REP element-mobilizing transposase RayT